MKYFAYIPGLKAKIKTVYITDDEYYIKRICNSDNLSLEWEKNEKIEPGQYIKEITKAEAFTILL